MRLSFVSEMFTTDGSARSTVSAMLPEPSPVRAKAGVGRTVTGTRGGDAGSGVAWVWAGLACCERALLRAMGGPITLAHGWEDLAAFG